MRKFRVQIAYDTPIGVLTVSTIIVAASYITAVANGMDECNSQLKEQGYTDGNILSIKRITTRVLTLRAG